MFAKPNLAAAKISVGSDECDPASGFGDVVCAGDTLIGRIYIHAGDDSWFVVKKLLKMEQSMKTVRNGKIIN